MTEAENRYVKKCVRKHKLPGKFRREMEALGIVYQGETCNPETCLPVTLPQGYQLYRRENNMILNDPDGHHVLEIQLIKKDNVKHWYRSM